ncbi:MAG TPA: hypothetical protein H9912_13045 [Candidatus Eisenbergiella stercorigallinarum]|uniref:Serine acetyltransferase n=1 Tax=Candidatus Eisenbergiella stercorigallinarum TaxID=2838557 RepID=A0A9D2U1I2_9FIRM|nr:hypothetical protein [Candidatus Eisenbergiella stercorigallinarum]
MICDKKDLKEYLSCERTLYFEKGRSACFKAWLLGSKMYRIWQFLRTLRLAEYHKNQSGLWHHAAFAWYHRRKYALGIRLGFEIPENCFAKGLMIYHIAPIVVNEDARIGENCRITGNCCIGNTGADTPSPVLGSDVTLGWGCSVIGDIRIADGAVIGAGCVVVKNVEQKGAHVAGVPGHVLSAKRRS